MDGKFLTKPPIQSVLDGTVSKVPFVTGDCDDEGTLFAEAFTDIMSVISSHKILFYLSNPYCW